IPVPAIDSTLKANMAGSAISLGVTGGCLSTALSRPGIENFHCQTASMNFLNSGIPQTNTNTVRMIQGTQALASEMPADAAVARASASSASGWSTLDSSWRPRILVVVQISLGCQTFRNSVSAPSEIRAEITSTSHGPWKFDTRYCGTAKLTPAT